MTLEECKQRISEIFGFHATGDRMEKVDEALRIYSVTPKAVPLTREAPLTRDVDAAGTPKEATAAEDKRLLDQYAICALNGMYAGSDVSFDDEDDHEIVVKEAFDIAEKMLAERKKRWP